MNVGDCRQLHKCNNFISKMKLICESVSSVSAAVEFTDICKFFSYCRIKNPRVKTNLT
jgi:hypothetical protein